MAGRQRQPIELIQARGKKHLTKAEIEERKSTELKVNLKDIHVPKYLPKKLAVEFEDISSKLLEVGIMTELDENLLAMYLIAQQNYLKYTTLLNKAMRTENVIEMEKYISMQDKAFKQTLAAANGLGLTISSRAKLVMPPETEKPKANKFSKFVSDVNG